MAGSSETKANLVQLGLELGLRLAILKYYRLQGHLSKCQLKFVTNHDHKYTLYRLHVYTDFGELTMLPATSYTKDFSKHILKFGTDNDHSYRLNDFFRRIYCILGDFLKYMMEFEANHELFSEKKC